jgi:hypothetical protein
MLYQIGLMRGKVVDIPMDALYANEESNLKIKKIFLVEIHILEIEKKLCALSRSFLGKSNFPGLVMSTIRCSPYA